MAVVFTGAGVASAASGASPQAVTTATSFAVGDFLVALIAYDNSGGGGADPMSGTITVSPATGAVGSSVSAQTGTNDPGASSAGLDVRCVAFPVTTAIPNATSCNVAWSGTLVVRAVAFMKVSSGAVINYRTNSGATGGNTVAAATATALVTPSVNNGEGVLCWAGHEYGEAVTGDADTTNGNWSAVYGTNTGSTTSGMGAYFQSKVVTATATQSFAPSGTSSDWITGCLIFNETPLPLITQASYRFYNDDGSETASTAAAAQDTALSADVTSGDDNLQLRIRLQETAGGVVPSTDDWQLQYEKNVSGSWIDVTTSSSNVAAFDSANLTGTGATTNRLGAGSGSFVAGEVTEDGAANDKGWTASNFTEMLYAIKVKAADLANGDVLKFRVERNAATTSMTYTVTPQINVSVVASIPHKALIFNQAALTRGSRW